MFIFACSFVLAIMGMGRIVRMIIIFGPTHTCPCNFVHVYCIVCFKGVWCVLLSYSIINEVDLISIESYQPNVLLTKLWILSQIIWY